MKALCPAPQQLCRCAACVAASGLHLLATGRAGMASRVLDGLPEAIRDAVAEAYTQGVDHGLEAARKARSVPAKQAARTACRSTPAPAFRASAAELARHVAALGADRVAEALGVALDDLGAMLEGRVAPPASGMRRLRGTVR